MEQSGTASYSGYVMINGKLIYVEFDNEKDLARAVKVSEPYNIVETF